MSPNSHIDTVIEALNAVKLYRGVYASSVDAANGIRQIVAALEATEVNQPKTIRSYAAQAIRDAYNIRD